MPLVISSHPIQHKENHSLLLGLLITKQDNLQRRVHGLPMQHHLLIIHQR